MGKPLKIAIGVHGRFHAFGLAAGLLKLGHDVTVFTNYPAFIAARFGIPAQRVRGFAMHGVVMRLADRLRLFERMPGFDGFLHGWFGSWLARRLTAERWDATYTWSSVSKEYLECERVARARLVARGSTHIRRQWQLLHEEEMRTGCVISKPSEAIMQREEAEYALADAVIVLSSFSRQTFLEAGLPPEKVRLMVSAVHVADFAATPEVVQARRQRILSGEPLRVLSVGTFSHRKGALDLVAMAGALPADQFQFRFVGSVADEAAVLAEKSRGRIEFIPRVPQKELREHYEWADIFVLPSIEEGLAAVLPQAAAAGLLVLATPNSGAADVIQEGVTGWIMAVRDVAAFTQRLNWIACHRLEMAALAESCSQLTSRDWQKAADDFVRCCQHAHDIYLNCP
jgi:glycosyltransferase involved in cell wall biosynthesis